MCCARVTAVVTFSAAPEISSGRSRATLVSYSRLILHASAPGNTPRTSYQVMPG